MLVLAPLQGLGATTTPAPQYLKQGYVWVPWLLRVGSTQQRTSCGTASERKTWPDANKMLWVNGAPGCWMGGGKAWGQQPAIGEHGDDVRALISRTTTVTTTTTPPTQSPGQLCSGDWVSWKSAHPVERTCAGDAAGQQQFAAICVQMRMGTLAPATGLKLWNDYVARRCGQPRPPATPPATPPTQMPPPGDFNPPTNLNNPPANMNPPTDGRDPGSMFDPGAGGDAPATTGARAFLRQVGPVVGIGLLAAIVLTVARKKKLLTRRR